MRTPGEIAFSKDIIEEVSAKTGYSTDKVKENYYALLDTIKKMTMEEEVSTIYIPYLGSLYFKPLHFTHFLKNVKDKEKDPYPGMIRRTERLMDNFSLTEYHRQMKRNKLSNLYFTRGKNKRELEEHQNKAYDKLKESQDYR